MGTEPRILKGGAAPEARRIEAAVFDADRRVREMVAAAEERARAVLAAAEAERARVVDDARELGLREGQARAAATLARAAAERDALLRDAVGEIARLSVAIARKVIGRELDGSGTAVALAEAALAAARDRRRVVLRVSPADIAAIRAAGGRLGAALGRAPLDVREDGAVPPGGAVVETDAGRIDAGIEAQLEVLARALEEALP